jgi:hypothetical protein
MQLQAVTGTGAFSMRRNYFVILGAVWICLTAGPQAADVQVVANVSVGASAVSAKDLKDVFLGAKTTLSDGTAVEPVLAEGGPAHDAFLKDYVGKSDTALRTYLKSQVFTGKGSMPKSFSSDADIVKYVAKTKGAIAYVSSSTDTAGVKKLAVN